MRQVRPLGFAALFAAVVFAFVPAAGYAVTVEVGSGFQSGASPLAVNVSGNGLTVTGSLTDLQAGGLDQLIYTGAITNPGTQTVTTDVFMFSGPDFAALPPGVYATSLSASGFATDTSNDPTISDTTGDSFTISGFALDNTQLALPQFNGSATNSFYNLGPVTSTGPCGVGVERFCPDTLEIDVHLTLLGGHTANFPITLSQTTKPVPEPMTALLVVSGIAGYGMVRRFRRAGTLLPA